MPLDRFDRGPEDWDAKPKHPWLKILLQRTWLLVVPLIAIGWYEGRVLSPQAKKLDAQIAETRAQAEGQRTKTLSEARRVEIGMSLLAALGDTFQVRFAGMSTLIDSVSTLKLAEEQDLKFLEAQAESLRGSLASSEGRWMEASVKLPPLQTQIDSLTKVIAAREEQIANLESEIRAAKDSADRVLRPDAYRKNSALLTGPGNFPNRDALPKR